MRRGQSRQPLAADLAKHLILAAQHLARRGTAELAADLVGLGQQADVRRRAEALERPAAVDRAAILHPSGRPGTGRSGRVTSARDRPVAFEVLAETRRLEGVDRHKSTGRERCRQALEIAYRRMARRVDRLEPDRNGSQPVENAVAALVLEIAGPETVARRKLDPSPLMCRRSFVNMGSAPTLQGREGLACNAHRWSVGRQGALSGRCIGLWPRVNPRLDALVQPRPQPGSRFRCGPVAWPTPGSLPPRRRGTP